MQRQRYIFSISGLSRDPRQTSLTRRIWSSGGGRRHSPGGSAPPVPPPSPSWPTGGCCAAPASWACAGAAPPGCRRPRPGAASAAPNSGQFCSNCSEVTVCRALQLSLTSHNFLWVLNSPGWVWWQYSSVPPVARADTALRAHRWLLGSVDWDFSRS